VTATVWEPAALPTYPVTPNFVLNTVLALILGVTLGVGLALLLEYLDDRWRSPEEAEQVVGVPVYGVVPEFKVLKKGRKGA
jgi:capsular polysaccharide biosynthesis protein